MSMRAPSLYSVLLSLVLFAGADEVWLKNGNVIEGNVVEKGDRLEIATGGGRMTIDPSQVDRIPGRSPVPTSTRSAPRGLRRTTWRATATSPAGARSTTSRSSVERSSRSSCASTRTTLRRARPLAFSGSWGAGSRFLRGGRTTRPGTS